MLASNVVSGLHRFTRHPICHPQEESLHRLELIFWPDVTYGLVSLFRNGLPRNALPVVQADFGLVMALCILNLRLCRSGFTQSRFGDQDSRSASFNIASRSFKYSWPSGVMEK